MARNSCPRHPFDDRTYFTAYDMFACLKCDRWLENPCRCQGIDPALNRPCSFAEAYHRDNRPPTPAFSSRPYETFPSLFQSDELSWWRRTKVRARWLLAWLFVLALIGCDDMFANKHERQKERAHAGQWHFEAWGEGNTICRCDAARRIMILPPPPPIIVGPVKPERE